MIKIKGASIQKLDKEDMVIDGTYTKDISFLGIKLYSKTSILKNGVNDNKTDKKVGFGKK